jgi:hypothetical protein
LPAAGHPHVAGAQPVAQFRQHAEFVMAPVDGAAGQHVVRPALADEPGRRGFRQGGFVRAVRLAQHSMARISEADAGTLSNANASRKAGDQRRMPA